MQDPDRVGATQAQDIAKAKVKEVPDKPDIHNAEKLHEARNLTHFVRIPLATRASLLQILSSYSRIEKDTDASVIPKGAFTHPANLHLSLGPLSLPTPSHLEAASKLVRSAIARQEDQALTAHVVGIGNPLASREPRDVSGTIRLFARIEDPTNSLRRFCVGVFSTLRDEGLLKPSPFDTCAVALHAKVMSTIALARGSARGKVLQKPLRLRIDATDVHRKYKDFVLMQDVHLQELHISEIGMQKVLYDDVEVAGYRNVATVSLPGIAGDGTKPLQIEMAVRTRAPNV